MHKLVYVFCIAGTMVSTSCRENTTEEGTLESRSDMATESKRPASVAISEDSTLQPIQEVKIKAIGNNVDQMTYSKDTIRVKAGALVKVEFINEGTELPMVHNFVVADSGTYKAVALAGEKAGSPGNYLPPKTDLLAASPLALPGQTVIVEFQAPLKPTVYDFVCTYPGHWKKMHGTLVVK